VKKLTALVLLALPMAQAAPAQDMETGKAVFKNCAACHRIGEGAKNAAGPVLNNVIGRAAGTFKGFKYGKGMKEAAAKGLVWDAEKIDAYITDPKKYLRAFTGNKKAKAKMRFKLKDPQKRRDVVAYIASFSNPVPPQAAMPPDALSQNNMVSAPTDIKANRICVQNAGKHPYFFAVDAGSNTRLTNTLAPGETLCTTTTGIGKTGKVSVFETAEHLEGCTRIIPVGSAEQMLEYADFDRCRWSSNDN
jgi:cytochrome c2